MRTKEIQFNNKGQTIAVKQYGNPALPPVLAIHGWLDNANSFLPLAKRLHHEFCIHAIDLPGHGYSDHLPDYAYYHFMDGVYLLQQIILQLFNTPPILIGHSLGACIASMTTSVLTSSSCSHLILIDALGPLVSDEEKAHEQFSSFIKHQNKIKRYTPPTYKSIEQAAAVRASKGYLAIELANILCERGLEKTKEGYYWRHDKKLLLPSMMKLTNNMVLSFLEQIKIPSLMIQASDGFRFNKDAMVQRVNAVPNLQHQVVAGGHHIHMEQPKTIAALIQSFLT